MSTFEHIRSFKDLNNRVIREAVEDRNHALALLKHLESLSAPDTGAWKTLVVIALMANYAKWLPGPLYVKITGQAVTTIDVCVDNVSSKERLCKLKLHASIAEFNKAVEKLNAKEGTPLRVVNYPSPDDKLGTIELMMVVPPRSETLPPPDFHEAPTKQITRSRRPPARPKSLRPKKPSKPAPKPEVPPPSSVPTVRKVVAVAGSKAPAAPSTPVSGIHEVPSEIKDLDDDWE